MSRYREPIGPRRKVVYIERVEKRDYDLKFTLECGHVQVRSRHQECATISCPECKREQEAKQNG